MKDEETNARRTDAGVDNRRSGPDGEQDVQPSPAHEMHANQPNYQAGVRDNPRQGQSGQGTEAATKGLTFDEASHTYAMNGRPIPGVTSVISGAGLMGFHISSTEAMERGRAVHMICELFDKGELDPDKVPGNLRGYLDAWIKFRIEANVSHIEWCAETVYAHLYGYAGRIDRLASFRNKPLEYVLDIKSGQPAPWHRIQTAGYEQLRGPKNPIRYCVYLRPNGTFKLVEHDNYQDDVAVFNAALTIQAWKEHAR
jgi:hypothetical protein